MMHNNIQNLYGLIGYPLSHSFSKKYFNNKFKKENIPDSAYDLFPLDSIDIFPTLLSQHSNFKGINVTIPYKEAVLPYLDEIDEAAQEMGAVNTIKIVDGKLHGFNTDCYGFEISLKQLLQANINYKALVFGTGGAAKAIQYVLKKLDIPFQMVSRRKQINMITYSDIDESVLSEYLLLINTTPLGMSPNVDTAPEIPYDVISPKHILYDLVYNPEKTLFLKHGEQRQAQTKNGLEMLHLQAEKAWEIWNNPLP